MSAYFVIFGAAVRADGSPSGTLRRRVEGALAAARGVEHARFMPTGGNGASGFVEADVMARLLIEAGVRPEAILSERQARDTLQSVRRCDGLLRVAGDADNVTPCTSRYHILRCAILFWALGWRVRLAPMPGDQGLLSWRKLLWYYAREVVALPYDFMLLAAFGLGRRG
ncbi:MAG TPA: YdcF family protein [Caulobacteraceae bacterium]|jgi:uncharacterized SAM-binding protein YcdF (DUF218 family)